ncbi:hypothetical protein SeMB42_g00212 [Synchytrium endobioticum]|uniref:Uncharacterized protein n=1 Tax=Synchytrium endobioticum TaxID=286115 RepID=A0A507DTD0_9FUNG|nr:hypothetical protein SeMB42_g00212 [Synchytrium endobioticum]
MAKRKPSSVTSSNGKHITFALDDQIEHLGTLAQEEENAELDIGAGKPFHNAVLDEEDDDDFDAPPEESTKETSTKESKQSQDMLRRALRRQMLAEKSKRKDRQERLNQQRKAAHETRIETSSESRLVSGKARLLPEDVIQQFMTDITTATSENQTEDGPVKAKKRTKKKSGTVANEIIVRDVTIVKRQAAQNRPLLAREASKTREQHLFRNERIKRVPAIMNIGRGIIAPAVNFVTSRSL